MLFMLIVFERASSVVGLTPRRTESRRRGVRVGLEKNRKEKNWKLVGGAARETETHTSTNNDIILALGAESFRSSVVVVGLKSVSPNGMEVATCLKCATHAKRLIFFFWA